MKRLLPLVFVIAIILIFSVQRIDAATLEVCPSGGGCTYEYTGGGAVNAIQTAIDAAGDGDIVYIFNGTSWTRVGSDGGGIAGEVITVYQTPIVPQGTKENRIELIQNTLGTKIVQTTIASSVLVGTLAVGNSKSLLIPQNVTQKEKQQIVEVLGDEIEIIEVESKYTALGNLIVMNDKGAIISEMFEKNVRDQIQDSIGIETTVGSMLGSPLVGSIAMSTNRGALVHPLLSEEEISEISSILKVRTDVCTINRGIPYPRVGILSNTKGAVIGSDSTGPESMRIFEVLLAP